MTKMNKVYYSVASALLTLGLGVTPAWSQDTASSEAEDNQALERIVVTAERRTANLQEVPVSVSAFTEGEIDRRQIDSTLDVIRSVPNLVGSNNVGISSATSFFMRGVGQDESISTQDPAVGTYVDGVYISRQVANNAALYDIERIEVLRGPQGILYGRNTSGGAIKIITKSPHDELAGSIQAEVGNYETTAFSGKINVPVTDKVFVSLAAFNSQRDKGFQKNITLNTRTWDESSSGVRGALKYEATDNFEIVLSAEYAEQEDTGVTGTNFFGNNADDLFVVESGLEGSFNKIEQSAMTANMTWQLDNSVWTSITGYRDLDQDTYVDFSDNPVPAFVIGQVGSFQQFSQEIQGSGEMDKFSWVVGAFFMEESNDNIRRDELFLFGGALAGDFVADFENDSQSWAVFGQGSYELTDQLTATLGGRWTREEKSIDMSQLVDVGGGVLIELWNNTALEALGTDTDPTFEDFTPHVSLKYQFDADTMAYVSYSEGFKSGGWNGRATDPREFNLIEAEYVDAYEIGFKTEFWNNRVRMNTALFYNEYTDFIVTALNPDTGGFVTINAATTNISGIEMEFTASATAELDLYANFGYLTNKYDELGENVVFNIDNEVKRTPELTAQIGFNYFVTLDDAELVFTADYSYQDEYYGGAGNTIAELSESTKMLYAAASYKFGDGKYQLTLACENCTDQQYHHSTLDFSALGFATQFPGAPRTYSLKGKMLF
jgi:iron complex outermembrane receptor protein